MVHHGGAGTLHTATRAGVPSVIIPASADTFFWRGRAVAIGIAAFAPELKRATAGRVFSAVRAVYEGSYRRRTQALAEAMQDEDGTENAANRLAAHFFD